MRIPGMQRTRKDGDETRRLLREALDRTQEIFHQMRRAGLMPDAKLRAA